MFSHVVLGTDDMAASRAFYDATLATLGIPAGREDEKGRVFYLSPGGMLGITRPIDGRPASSGNGGTIGFAAVSTDAVDAWHEAGVRNGGTSCEDPPGIREMSGRRLYLAYLRDPAGNKLCALHRIA